MTKILVTLTALVGLFGFSFGAVQALDTRYAPMSEFEDLHWSALRREIREIREQLRTESRRDIYEELERDLEDLLAVFCKRYPDDRYCE